MVKTWLYCISLGMLLVLSAGNRPVYSDTNPAPSNILEQVDRIPQWIEEGRLQAEDIPNPHWQDNACKSCHTGKPAPGRPALRSTDREALCTNCHGPVSSHAFIHISGLKPVSGMLERMPDSYRLALQNGELACTTCHDLPAQCLDNRRRERAANPMFLRGAPFRYRTDSCYLCHDAASYQRINPHDQISDAGEVREVSCQRCHDNTEKLKTAQTIEDVDFSTGDDLSTLCTGCHPWIPHPGGSFMIGEKLKDKNRPVHLAAPSQQMRKHMQDMAARNGIILPLDPTNGKVFCGTCHNPHEKGLIKDAAAARGADEKQRLRMQQMCTNCHEK